MTPETCAAEIGALPPTGADGGVVLPLLVLGVGLLGIGLVVLMSLRRRDRGRRASPAVAALALALLLGAGTVALAPAPAHATAGTVSYGAGCTLVEVSGVLVAADGASDLVPGDDVRLVQATVRNPTDAPVRIVLAGRVGVGLADAVVLTTTIAGAPATEVELAPGGTVTVALFLRLPETAGDDVQVLSAPASLLVTATQS